MPQWVHDAASVIQIVVFAAALYAYLRREAIFEAVGRHLQGVAPPPTPHALTGAQIRATLLRGFGSELQVRDLQETIVREMAKTQCLREQEDRSARLRYYLDWERFFRMAERGMWKQVAVRIAHPLQEEAISRIVVLPWPRSSGKASYDSFTSVLVENLGSQIAVDHVKESNIRQGVPLPSFADGEHEAVAIFEPFEVADGFLKEVVEHLRTIHGCDMKAIVTFFKTNTEERELVPGMKDIQVVRLALAREGA